MRVEVALADIPRSSTIETRLSHTALTLVSEGVGIATIDPSSATEFRGRGVVVKPFSGFLDAGFLAIGGAIPHQMSWHAALWISSGFITRHYYNVCLWQKPTAFQWAPRRCGSF
jgi:hypothetical protein